VATVPGSAFGDCGEQHIRFSYSTSKENIIEGFRRIKNIADELA
jgi:aminotransferase